MRISKLFHWLYASIMLMPIFAIGVKSLYVTFNPNAKDSYYGETINQEQNIQVQNVNDLLNSTTYTYIGVNFSSYDNTSRTRIYFDTLTYNNVDYETVYLSYYQTQSNVTYTYIINTEDDVNILIDIRNETMMCVGNIVRFQTRLQTYDYILNQLYYIEYNDYSYIDNVFYYSVNQISNEPLFSWSNNTFLAQPLLFITNLFGVPSTSPIITILCYWFAISVIWLVFDVIMYIPLLVHRWLDKGVIE